MQKIMVAVLCFSLSFCSVSSAATNPEPENTKIQAEECGSCGGHNTIRLMEFYYNWRDIDTAKCKKYTQKLDMIEKRRIYCEYRCRRCGTYQKAAPVRDEIKITCNH